MPRFAYTLRTIGANEVELQEESSYWSFWKVQFNTPIGSDYGYYLYLKANCPFLEGNSTNIKRWRELSEPKKYQIVVTPRSRWNSNLEAVRKKFKGELAISSQTLVRQALMQNVKFRDIDTTDPFIEPNVASLLVPEKGVNSLQMLKDWISREDAKSILVLVGDGGMGKTTLVRQLANDLQRGPNRIYPILIESDQWRYALHSRLDLADIWDLAIRRSLDHSFSHNFIYHEDAFHTLVSEGLFVIIFDGFDELCLNPQFPGGPREIINQLMSYIHSDDDDKPARIL